MLTFAASLFLFQLANAAMLPVVGAALVYEGESRSSLIVAALIILPQIVVALSAPWVGRQARSWGRRPLLIIGFGTLPVRALLFAFFEDPLFLIGFQLLDGISGAIIGVLTALVPADITHGSGRFNLAQGIIGTASGIGAALSTAVFGLIAANFGHTTTFLSMAAVALLGASIMWLLMPETRPSTEKYSSSGPIMEIRSSALANRGIHGVEVFCVDSHALVRFGNGEFADLLKYRLRTALRGRPENQECQQYDCDPVVHDPFS